MKSSDSIPSAASPASIRLLLSLLFILFASSIQAQEFYSYGGTIPNIGTTVNFPQTVSGVGAISATDGLVRVCLSITQARAGDMDIFLVSPAGTIVELSTDNGGTSGNDYHRGICLSTCGPSGPIAGANDFRGVYTPEGILGNFNNGQNADGVWQLRITDDNGSGTSSTLNFWSIQFESPVPPTVPNGMTCAPGSAFVLNSLPYSHTCQTLAGSGNNYTNGACNSHIDGSEYIFTYTPATADEYLSIDIAQDFSAPSGFPTVSLLDTCPGVALAANCIQTEIQFNSTENILWITSVPLIQGKTYYIAVASTSGEGGDFDIRIGTGRNGDDDCLNATSIQSGLELAGNNYAAVTPNLQAPNTSEMTCNGSIDNILYYTFTTDALGGTVHANITDIFCSLSCGGACGIQVALFQAPAGGPCLGAGTWGAPISCETSTLANAYYTWNGLLPNTQYFLMVDGTAGSECVWNIRVLGGFQNSTLPVTLADFSVVNEGKDNLVRWTSTAEPNVSHYELEHTQNLPDFTLSGIEAARAKAGEMESYKHLDKDVLPGWHYYRLKMVDLNGSSRYSGIAKVLVSMAADALVIYPTLVETELHVRYRAEGTRVVVLRGMDGRVFATYNLEEAPSEMDKVLQVEALPAGMYFLELHDGAKLRFVEKFVKR